MFSSPQRLWAIEGEAQGEPLHAYASAALCVLLKKQLIAARGPDELLRAFNDIGKATAVDAEEWVNLTAMMHLKQAKRSKRGAG